MHRLSFVVVASALLLGFSGRAQAQGNSIFDSRDHLWVVGNVQVPPVADTFALVGITRYPVLNLGVSLTYSSPIARGLEMTVYVYPAPSNVPDPVRSEFDAALREVREYAVRQRPEMTVTISREEPFALTTSQGETLQGMIAEGEYTQAGRTRRTVLYVFQKTGLMLKYRLSHDKDTPVDLTGHFDSWLETTAEKIQLYTP